MYCSKCGKKNKKGDKFCGFCGEKIEDKIEEKIIDKKEEILNLLPTTELKRFLNFLLDQVGVLIFSYILGIMLATIGLQVLIDNTTNWILGVVISVLYYTI
ncbi:MAG: zinc ribbon domain-containing protein, partial [Bacteroidales bacterium]|nr:zinc ribbon domain-containing protein [Bacteroidales bacterium]